MIITLCGSTRFKDEYIRTNEELTLAGHTVFSVGIFARDFNLSKEQLAVLDKVHRNKIDLSDAILVLNKDGYTGDRTDSEVTYAHDTKKKIIWLDSERIPSQHYWTINDWMSKDMIGFKGKQP